MDTITAGDIMVPLDEYPHIPYWFTLRQAIAAMEAVQIEQNGVYSLPRVVLVFDEAYRLLGMARRRDILRGLEPPFLSASKPHHQKQVYDVEIDPALSEFAFETELEKIKKQADKPISEVMRPIASTVDKNHHIMHVISEMVRNNQSILPVLGEGRVIGVVRTVDILHILSKSIL